MVDNHLSDEEYIQTQHSLVTLGALVRRMPLDAFVNRASEAQTLGPIIDPTLYREAADKLSDVKALAKSLMPFQKEMERQLAKVR